MNKREVRDRMFKLRASMSRESREILSRDIAQKAFNEIIKRDFRRIMCYYSYKGEVETHDLIKMLKKSGIEVALPRVESGNKMSALVWDRQPLVPNKYRIMEPPAGSRQMDSIEAVIMPGLAFDYKGARLGYGGGYYDRFLKGKDVFKIGICFDAQLLMELPNETFDIPVDVVISDCRILEF